MAAHSTASATVQDALTSATDTRQLEIGFNILQATPAYFSGMFPDRKAVIVADPNTFDAAGRTVADAFERAGLGMERPFIFSDPALYAEHGFVDALEASCKLHQAIPLAVGAGTINDIVKLVAHRVGRRYMSIATAASMDGYTAFGASITYRGSKQTFDCPAPLSVIADLSVIAAAPPINNAAGYADLAAKITAGADWILADALGVEPIDSRAWSLVQDHLRNWLQDPQGVRRGDTTAIAGLVEGLMMGGFAMQWMKSSRCASGAEHQFSHLWDMEHHTHQGAAPSHGFKVGIATLAITRLYEQLLQQDFTRLDVAEAVSHWPDWKEMEASIRALYEVAEIREKAIEESRAKYIARDALAEQLNVLVSKWGDICGRIQKQLIPSDQLAQMLAQAGAPIEPEMIGISQTRLKQSHRKAAHIRRRFTLLDLAARIGQLPG